MEQKPSGENILSWREAIIEALKTSNKPMSSVEIVAVIKERGLRKVSGNTPEATVGAQIYSSIKKDGESSPFVQISPNVFRFKQPSKVAGDVSQPNGGIIPANDLKSDSKITKQRMLLTYDDPLTAVFLRILAWEEYEANRQLRVKDIVSDQVQMARKDLGLKRNTKGAPHAFIQSLRKKQPPLLDGNKPAEKGWARNLAWSLRYLPSHQLVRMLSYNPIWEMTPQSPESNLSIFQFSVALREPALPKLRLTVGKGKPTPKTPGNIKGVYFLRQDEAIYIGQSDEFYIRYPQHIMKGKKVLWWAFIAPQETNGTLTFDSLYAIESLLISFWKEVCEVTNKTRGKDTAPDFVHLQPAILFVEAASAALLWLIRNEDLKSKFSQWGIPLKKKCSGRGWPSCYLENPIKGNEG